MDAMDPKVRAFYRERLREIVQDGTAEGALTTDRIVADAALADDLLCLDGAFADGEIASICHDFSLDAWPAGQEFVARVLNRHGLPGLWWDHDHDPAPDSTPTNRPRCEVCGNTLHLSADYEWEHAVLHPVAV